MPPRGWQKERSDNLTPPRWHSEINSMSKSSKKTKIHLALIKQLITLSTGGFGLIAALAWNNLIQEFVNDYVKKIPSRRKRYTLITNLRPNYHNISCCHHLQPLQNPRKIRRKIVKNFIFQTTCLSKISLNSLGVTILTPSNFFNFNKCLSPETI